MTGRSRNHKKHVSTIKYHSYVSYFNKHYRHFDLDDIIRQSGSTLAHLMSFKNWVSIEFDYKFHQYIISLTGEKDIAFNACSFTYGPQKWGPVLSQIVQRMNGVGPLMAQAAQFVNSQNGINQLNFIEGDHHYSLFKSNLNLSILSEPQDIDFAAKNERNNLLGIAGFLVAAARSNLVDIREKTSIEIQKYSPGQEFIYKIIHVNKS